MTSSADTLEKLACQGAIVRYGQNVPKNVKDRLAYELKVINKAGFADYLLVIWDVYDFMRSKKIPYGFGRGSAAGSVVCYCLFITDVDPLRFNLLFERFLNAERVSMPDIDCDISQERRQEVIDYVKERYGSECVANIITYQTLGGRAAIRDMARVLGKDLALADKVAKLIPKEGSVTVDKELRHYIKDALKSVKELKKLYTADPNVKEIIDLAISMEGLTKSESVHASGVVIADQPLGDIVPIAALMPADKQKAKKGRIATIGYDMWQIEEQGLIKFDFLGLRNLDIIEDTLNEMKRDKIVPKDFNKLDIPLDDPKTFNLLSRGLTAGVFQLESGGMRKYIKDLKPDRVDDVIAMVALYRPGPMQFIPEYIARKNGQEKVVYPHPSLKTILEPTYGLVVYQEQIMQVGEIIAGWSKSRADQLRKVVGKKIIDKIEQEKQEFVADAVKQGHKKAWATDLFVDFIEPAARYAFNLSHAASYGMLSYITAYLKANYPTYYFGSLLASVQDKRDKITAYIADARAMGVSILPPDVHESNSMFTALPERNSIRYGLSAIKNVGEQAVALIIKERKKGDFTDLFNFVERTKNQLVNTRTISSLILAGAMDSLPGTRDELAASVDKAVERAAKLAEDKLRVSEGRATVKRKVPIPDTVLEEPDTVFDEQAILSKERELIGTYISGHPFEFYADEAHSVSSSTIEDLRELENEQPAVLCGIVTNIREHTTKKNKLKMLFVTLEDDTGAVEITVFPKPTREYGPLFELDKPAVVRGYVDIAEADTDLDEESEYDNAGEVKFICQSVTQLDASPTIRRKVSRPSSGKRDSSCLTVTLSNDGYSEAIEQAKQQVSQNGYTRVVFLLPNDTEYVVDLKGH